MNMPLLVSGPMRTSGVTCRDACGMSEPKKNPGAEKRARFVSAQSAAADIGAGASLMSSMWVRNSSRPSTSTWPGGNVSWLVPTGVVPVTRSERLPEGHVCGHGLRVSNSKRLSTSDERAAERGRMGQCGHVKGECGPTGMAHHGWD